MAFGDVARVRRPAAGASGTYWPFEGGHVDYGSLVGLLQRTAQGFAREALAAMAATDHDKLWCGGLSPLEQVWNS